MEAETEGLRRSAPSWSLAGDQRLLDTLQNMHAKLLTKCSDTSEQLNAMCTALTDAALALDNVNNRFMSLSNSQFVERRVYDDDADVTPAGDVITSQKTSEQPLTTSEPATERIKRALKVLESTHETVVIMAYSDSDSGSEEDGDIDRVVLKPKDLYRERPLPYIIGSKAWKGKWHAGTLPDASGSDSDRTNGSDGEFGEYSENERYSPGSVSEQVMRPTARDQISTSSSEVMSERDLPTEPVITQPLSPAAIAAELARRLQGHQPEMPPQPVMEESQPQYLPRKVYKPEKPAPGAIFSDEPPPLDSSDHDEDIFAELRKSKPFAPSNKAQNSVANDLFGVKGTEDLDDESEEDDDIFNDFPPKAKNKPTPPVVKQSAPVDKPETKPIKPSPPVTKAASPEGDGPININKKPVGGISIFHGSQNSAIGAAILQRQRQASGDDTDRSGVTSAPKQTTHKPESKEEVAAENKKTHRDIFDDLFARSEKVIAKRKVDSDVVEESVVKKEEKKVSLFSDNIFDDIDDIFTSDVIPKVPIKEVATRDKRSLFDDDDDLFKDIITVTGISSTNDNDTADNVTENASCETNTSKNNVMDTKAITSKNSITNKAVSGKKTNIFDSDDELFSDKYPAPKRMPIATEQRSSKSTNAYHTDNDSIATQPDSKNRESTTAEISDTDELFAKMKSMDFASEAKTAPVKVILSDSSIAKGIFDSDEDVLAENDLKFKTADIGKEATTSAYVKNVLASKESVSNTDKKAETIISTDDELFNDSISYIEPVDFTLKGVSSQLSETASKENLISAIQSVNSILEEDENVSSENKPDSVKGATSQMKYNQAVNIFHDCEHDDDIFVITRPETKNETIIKTEPSTTSIDTEAKSKTVSPEKIDIFKDESNSLDDKHAGMKAEQMKRGTHESNEDLYKKYSNKETKVTTAAYLDEQKVIKVMEENTIDDKTQFIEQIMKHVDHTDQAESKSLSRDKLDAFNDEANFIDDEKTEQIKRGAEDLYQNISNKKTKELLVELPNVDEKKVKKIMEERTVENKAEFINNILKPADDVIEELKPDTSNDLIESVLHSFHDEKVNASERSSDEVKKIESILSETELKLHMGESMKFHDILQEGHKDVPKTNISTRVKPEVLRKPRAKKDLHITTNYNSKDTISNVGEINSAEVDDDKLDNVNVLDANKNVTSKKIGPTTTAASDTQPTTPDIFSELLNDVPPIFEKPKEPKKSKNVNALFDDDSDDEALFYRKSDATLEDVPKIEKRDSSSDDNDRFKLFMNEPPAIDDFEHDSNNAKSKIGAHSCLINSEQMIDEPDKHIIEKRHTLNRTVNKRDVISTGNKSHDSDDELFGSKSEPSKMETDTPNNNEQQTKTKKIGKLKPSNLNINVNTLLPGALPKKSAKNLEETDGQTESSHSTEELHTKTAIDDKVNEPILVKSVSFDEDPESTLLDNKLSKERARIKVKRRPSSRKARREASRISGIDFGEDFTDNSNSIDDVSKSEDVSVDYSQTVENRDYILYDAYYDSPAYDSNSKSDTIKADVNVTNKKSTIQKADTIEADVNKINKKSTPQKADDIKSISPAVEKDNINKNKTKKCGHAMKECKCSTKTEQAAQVSSSSDEKHQETKDIMKSHQDMDTSTNVIPQQSSESSKDAKQQQEPAKSRDVKSKVVYILHDEDIFNNTKAQKTTEDPSKPKMLNIVDDYDDDDDIFKSMNPATKGDNVVAKLNDQAIKTLGNVYKSPENINGSDDDIFKDKQKIKNVPKPQENPSQVIEKYEVSNDEVRVKRERDLKVKQKRSIFDDLSDEENELFNSKQKTVTEKKQNKTSLFDSDSDTELFSGKSKKEKADTSAVLKKEIKRVEVKASLFGDDDDDDIFGAKPTKTASSLASSSSSRNDSEVTPQTGTSDPLSALLDQK